MSNSRNDATPIASATSPGRDAVPADSFDFTVPVIVVGGGAAGATAALALADAGVAPLVIERDEHPAGSTAMSQGLLCAAGTASQAEHGVVDDGATFYADILAKTRGQTDPAIASAIAYGSGPALDWLVTAHDLPWQLDTAFRPAYGNSRQRVHGWPGHSGDDMIALLHARLADAGIDVVLGARLTEIFVDDCGAVSGIALTRPDGTVERIGCRALILASGGFGGNAAMVAANMPEMANARYHGHEGNDGGGIRLGQALGAAVGDMGSYQGYAMLTDPHGISVPPGVLFEGGVIVNRDGERFIDESADIAGMVHPLLAQPGGQCWVIYDAAIEARCIHIPELSTLNELGAPRHGTGFEELAATIDVPAQTLNQVVAEARDAADAGRPDRFGRDWGSDRPPQGDLRAMRVTGALYHTQGGLQIDGDARVLRPDGSAIAGLYAAGGAARGVSGPSSWGYLPAMGLCAAVTLGRIAGISAAKHVQSS